MRQSLATENPLKMTKNVFYFTLKAIFVLKIFKCLCWLFGHIENGLIKKIRLISKFITSQPGKQTIAIHILSIILRSKGNGTRKTASWKIAPRKIAPYSNPNQNRNFNPGGDLLGGGQSSGGQFPAMRGNQTMKFGQLIEYNMRNIFLEKSYTKYGGETIPRPFSKKSNLSIL